VPSERMISSNVYFGGTGLKQIKSSFLVTEGEVDVGESVSFFLIGTLFSSA
jgi:hypothetical protein